MLSAKALRSYGKQGDRTMYDSSYTVREQANSMIFRVPCKALALTAELNLIIHPVWADHRPPNQGDGSGRGQGLYVKGCSSNNPNVQRLCAGLPRPL